MTADPGRDGPGPASDPHGAPHRATTSSTTRSLLRRLLDSRSGQTTGDRPTRRDVLDRVCELAVTQIGASGVTVALLPSTQAHVVVGASSDVARGWEQAQFDLGEGPSAEADRAQLPVLVPDLHAERGRWPALVFDPRSAGVASVFAMPLRLGASRFGTLTLYRDRTGLLGPDDLVSLYVFADIVVELLIDTHHDDVDGDLDLASVLNDELDGQAVVYQAQGMVMVQLGCSLAEALARMRARAYAEGLTLSALSHLVVDGTTNFTKGTT